MHRVRMFGGLVVEHDRDLDYDVPRKSLALVALLVVAGENGMGREKLASYLWPESDSEHSRNALNQTLHQLRRGALREAITGNVDLRVDPACLTSDVGEFRSALGRNDLRSATELYAGAFLDGVYIRGAPLFERWAEEQRQRFANQYATILETLALQAEKEHDGAAAIMWWRKLVAHSPVSSRATLKLMQALASVGDHPAALQLARSHEELVREELDALPAPEIRAFADGLRARPNTTDAPSRAPSLLPKPATPIELSLANARARDVASLARPENIADQRREWGRRRGLALGLATAVLVLMFGAAIESWTLPNASRDTTSGVVSGPVLTVAFDNLSGDSTLDLIGPLVADWITQGLARTGVVTVARHSVELWDMPSLARTRPGDRANAWAEIGRAAGAHIVIHGSYVRSRDSIRVQATMADPRSGQVIQAIDPVVAPERDPFALAEQLRQRVMSVMAARMNPELTHWINAAGQPARFAAYLEYAEGMTAFADARWKEATAHFFRSAAEDSSYTLPLLWAAFSLHNNDEVARSDSLVNALNARRLTMAPLDRALHDYLLAINDPGAAFEASKRLVELAPGSEFQWKLASAMSSAGHLREALQLYKELDPDKSWVRGMDYWGELANLEMILGDYAEAREAYRRDVARGRGTPTGWASVAAGFGDAPELRRVLLEMAADPKMITACDGVDGTAWLGARALRVHGSVADAREIDEWGIAFIDTSRLVKRQTKDPIVAWWVKFCRAAMLYDLGRFSESQSLFERLDSLVTARGAAALRVGVMVPALGYLADLAVRRGDSAVVTRYRERIIASSKPEDGIAKYMLGRIAAVQGRKDEAVTILGALLKADIGWIHHLRIDPDLETLRAYPPFARLLAP